MSDGLRAGVIGNCMVAAVVHEHGDITWACMPRLDGDPVFHSLLGDVDGRGRWSVELPSLARSEQHYHPNTAVLVTRLWDGAGNGVEIRDFAPRFTARGRMFRPAMLVRRVLPIAGRPRVRIRTQPSFGYGEQVPSRTHGNHHVRFVGTQQILRLTSDAPVDYLVNETAFVLDGPVNLVLGPDEPLRGAIADTVNEYEQRTIGYWQHWCRRLALPLEWQDAVIRAAITLKLCIYEPTGAIVAALTTSIPEAPNSGRNWDYRYCWLRDAFFVIRALNSLADMETLENYLRYIDNLVGEFAGGHVQPVFGIGLETALVEREAKALAGYQGMGPVRVGNQAYEHIQHDVYGNIILAAAQSFFDQRLLRPGSVADFQALERIGERAFRVYNTPDAGMWELRSRASVHTSSALMCWAACDRLQHIAQRFERTREAQTWAERAAEIRACIEREAWNEELNSYTDSFGGQQVEAGLLLMSEVGFHPAQHPRFSGTMDLVEKRLLKDGHLFRYNAPDDFGAPENAFTVCTLWYIDALARMGRMDEAREAFEGVLKHRNHVGLLSEDLDVRSGALWGNFPQTYSMVGLINAAIRLSRGWESVV